MSSDPRISRDTYGLRLARVVADRADCTRRQVGAVLMDTNHLVVSTGYNGAPAGVPGCASAGNCPRGELTLDELPPSQGYELAGVQCIAVHAEMNAVIYAGRARSLGGTLFVTDAPCYLCRLVIQAGGLRRVVWPGQEWVLLDDTDSRLFLATEEGEA